MAEVDDTAHLEYATAHGRVMMTHDQDFLRLASEWRTQDKSHGGIFYIQQYLQGNIGQLVKYVLEYNEFVELGAATVEADIANQVIYIG